MNDLEMEFKYDASKIPLRKFQLFCSEKAWQSKVTVSGKDTFYSSIKEDDGTFFRLRTTDDSNELTFKRKTVTENSFIREEHNVPLAPGASDVLVTNFLKSQGYKYDREIYKFNVVYFYEFFVLSYYICYDSNMVELDRFIELEINEKASWSSEADAWNYLLILEKTCKVLGIRSQNRIKESLFEMYRKREDK